MFKSIGYAFGYDAKYYYDLGSDHLDKKNYLDALDNFDKSIDLDDSFAIAYFGKGYALHQMQQLDQAIVEYSKAITLYFELQMNTNESSKNPFTTEMTSIVAEIHANRGLALFTKGLNDEALRDFERAIELDPSLTAAHFNRGHALFKDGRTEEAVQAFTKAIEQDATNPQAWLGRGMSYLNLGKYEKAIDDFSKSLDIDSNLLSGYINRSQAYLEKKSYINAISDLSKALQLTSDSNIALLSLRAFAYTNLNHFNEAIADVTRIIQNKEETKLSERLHQRALLYFKLGKVKESIADIDTAIDLSGESAFAGYCYNTKAWIMCVYKQPDQATKLVNKAIRLNPRLAPAYDTRGVANMLLQKTEEAIEDFSRAIEIQDGFVEALTHRGKAYLRLKKYAEAAKDFDKVVQINPQFCHVYYYKAKLNILNNEKHEQAINDLTMYLQLKPKYYDPEFKEATALYHKALSYEVLGNKYEATQQLLQAFQLEPKNIKIEKKILSFVSATGLPST